MKSFTLTFVADDKTVLSRAFNYGDSIDESDIPEPPAKSGCHVHWDRTDLTNLHFDTVVTAVYEAYTPGLASEQTRESGQAVILVEGNYNDGDAITVTAQPAHARGVRCAVRHRARSREGLFCLPQPRRDALDGRQRRSA